MEDLDIVDFYMEDLDYVEFHRIIRDRYPYPSPLPPTRDIELIRTEADIQGHCCACWKAPGNLTCSRCKAVKYCSQDCHRKGWKKHKVDCNTIKGLREETKAAIERLSEEFGGPEALLKSPLVKEGGFKFGMGDQPGANQHYILARWKLIQAYVSCGHVAFSCTAFRLAAENILDVLCLAYSDLAEPVEMFMRYAFCGWMVAGGMDQQALDYLCYFQHRQMCPHRLPFLGSPNDIEEDSYLNMFKEEKGTCEWFNDFMIIALIKYKRLESLMVQRKNNMVSWEVFIKGVELKSGEESAVQKIRGNFLVLDKLEELVTEKTISIRINRLNDQIKLILSTVNEENKRIIPGIIDRSSIPEEGSVGDSFHASRASDHYGHAWKMSKAYTKALQLFLDAGEVTEEPESLAVEGVRLAAFDDNPTQVYDHGDDLG